MKFSVAVDGMFRETHLPQNNENLMWWQFLIHAGLIALGLWYAEKSRTRSMPARAGVVFFAALLGVSLYLNQAPPTMGDARSWYQSELAVQTTWFVFMLLGMLAQGLNKAIDERSAKVTELKRAGGTFEKPKLELDFWEFIRPLLFSVVTFSMLLSQMQSEALSVESLATSFLTGFFWQALVARKQPS